MKWKEFVFFMVFKNKICRVWNGFIIDGVVVGMFLGWGIFNLINFNKFFIEKI